MAPKLTKNQMRRAKKKEQKKAQVSSSVLYICYEWCVDSIQVTPTPEPETVKDQEPEIAHVKVEEEDPLEPDITSLDVSEDDPNFAMFQGILARFGSTAEEDEAAKDGNTGEKGEVFYDDDDEIPDEDEVSAEPKLSKKKRKERDKLSVAELKALVK
jgi:splicing factor 3B subunit 2